MNSLRRNNILVQSLVVILLLGLFDFLPFAVAESVKHRIYTHRLEPREHPDDSRRHVQPPDWETFDNRTHFTSLRGFADQDGTVINYQEELDRYTKTHTIGDVLWPAYPLLFAKNLNDVVDEIKRRNLYLFDIWGFVPGSGPGGYWQQYKPPEGVFDLLESKLGERWLGMDVGEQDGRYIGRYATEMVPLSTDRFHHYLYFQRHFQRMCDDLGNKMATLVSLNFGHYFLKEGVYTLIGAETAQGLPNSQVYYAFIRGAGKQYGVPWFGNASVFNRWGYKSYAGTGDDHSPTKGTSLSLFKRLMVSHILYNSVFVGFESGWFDADGHLSPIGHLQSSMNQWVQRNGQPGEMIVPIALMTDFFAGWTFPRHLYTSNVYRVWGNLPYEPGDYLTDGLLDMVYPRYQDSSYFHDETGFLTATPYGDAVDCLLSDAPLWLLNRYAVLVIAGALTGGMEIRDKLSAYLENGGHLIITAGNLAKLPGGLAGITVVGNAQTATPDEIIQIGGKTITESIPFTLNFLRYPESTNIIARCGEQAAAVETSLGAGTITVLASPFGIGSHPAIQEPIFSKEDQPLPKPYPLLSHVRAIMHDIFHQQKLFDMGENLGWSACRKQSGEYVVGVFNSTWMEQPLAIQSLAGPIQSITEWPLDCSERNTIGFLPENLKASSLGENSESTIAGGDVRVFHITLEEQSVETIQHQAPAPRPTGRILPLRDISSIKEAILTRPTFFEHYDGVSVDWRYIHTRDAGTLREESGWIERQGLRVIVDLSTGINLYPDLRLVDNDPQEYETSRTIIVGVLEKMALLQAHDLILSLHRTPENNFTDEQTRNSFETNLRQLCRSAQEREITLYLRLTPHKPLWNLEESAQFLDRVAAPNLRLAVSTSLLLTQKIEISRVSDNVKNKIGLWLLGTPRYDIGGQLWDINAPLNGYTESNKLPEIVLLSPDVPLVFDVFYRTQDEEYLDSRELKQLIP